MPPPATPLSTRTEVVGRRKDGSQGVIEPKNMAHRDAPAPRRTRSLEESLNQAAMQGSKVTDGVMARMDQGRTTTVPAMVTRQQAEDLRKEIGMPKESVQGWGRRSAVDRVDALATWLLVTDQAQQSLEYRMKSDILGAHRLRTLYSREIPFDPGAVEWMFINLGHTSIAWGASSPQAPFGANPQWLMDQFAAWQVERQCKQGADADRTRSAAQVRRIRAARS